MAKKTVSKKTVKKVATPSSEMLEARASGAQEVCDYLEGTGTGQGKLDVIDELVESLGEQAAEASSRELSDAKAADEATKGRQAAIDALKDAGFPGTISKAEDEFFPQDDEEE